MKENNAMVIENNPIKDINLDMNNLLNYLMTNTNWDFQAMVIYHPNKVVAENFLKFLGTFFPQVLEKKQIVVTSMDDLRKLSDGISREILNYGHVSRYQYNPQQKEYTGVKHYMWIDLKSVEQYSGKQFADLSFWAQYGKLVREYGREHF